MTNLTRWDPIREMMGLRRAMDRMFDESLYSQGGESYNGIQWELPLDVIENENEFVVKASLPGVNPDDLDITYNNNMLTIRGEIKSESEKQGDRYHMRERRYGTFSRSLSLPSTIKSDAVQANFDAGVLTLHLPKTEEVKPRRIPIQSGQGGQQRMIEGTSSERTGQKTR